MKKIKTNEDNYACSNLGEFTNWYFNSSYGYSYGTSITKLGITDLYYQSTEDTDKDYATARIVHKRRIYDLRTNDKITRLGWTRIAKKWARNVWKG